MAHGRYKTVVEASYERVAALLVDKVEKPTKYVGTILHGTILERGEDYVVRSMYEPRPLNLTIKEKITHRKMPGGDAYIYEHIDNARYTGTVTNLLSRIEGQPDRVELEYVMDWAPQDGRPDPMTDDQAASAMRNAVTQMKRLAERQVNVPGWVSAFYAATMRSMPGRSARCYQIIASFVWATTR